MATSTPMSERDHAFWERPEQVEAFACREPDLRLRHFVEALEEPAGVRSLDLGCAGGRNTEFLVAQGLDVVALDSSRAMVARTRSRLEPYLGATATLERVRRGRMDELDWAQDGSFQLIVAFGIYHNATSQAEWERTLSETARVLAPGGDLLVSVFTPDSDLSGRGVRSLAGQPNLFDGFPGGVAILVAAPTLDHEMLAYGLRPVVPTATVRRETAQGRRVTANGHYRSGSELDV